MCRPRHTATSPQIPRHKDAAHHTTALHPSFLPNQPLGNVHQKAPISITTPTSGPSSTSTSDKPVFDGIPTELPMSRASSFPPFIDNDVILRLLETIQRLHMHILTDVILVQSVPVHLWTIKHVSKIAHVVALTLTLHVGRSCHKPLLS